MEKKVSILFIGNSHTFVNDVPLTVKALALEDAFAGAVHPDQQALKLLDALGDSAREEETVEGMEAEEEENEEGPALDEHIWLSLKNAQKLVPVIASDRRGKKAVFPMQWGFSFPDRPLLINARSETAAQKPLFRESP